MHASRLTAATERFLAQTARWLQERTLLAILILLCIGGAAFFWQLSNLTTQLVRTMALQNAGVVSRALAEFRTLYTSEVVDRVLPHGIEVTHDYADRPGAIPLPATLSVLLGNRIGEGPATKAKVRLYSAYPFPWRKDGGAKDDFERQALAELDREPEQPFFRFEEYEGRPALRYATADRLRPNCVHCHNTHPSSPKKDWKVGDMRGVLEVNVSLEAAIGEIRSGLLRTSVLFGSGGALLIAFLALALGRIRRGNETQRASERRFRSVAETAHDAIVSADAAGKITYLNPAAERIFGYRAEELLNQPLTLLMPEKYRDAHRAGLARYLRTGEAHVIGRTVMLEGRRKDGSEFPVELSLAVWRTEETTFFSGILRDISDRKRAEQVLQQQAAELARSNAELEQYAYAASHDLQEPLRTVTSFTQLLTKRYGEKAGEDANEFAGHITEAVTRMRNLIEGLLAYSRVSRESERQRREPTDLNRLLETALANVEDTIKDHGATVTHDTLPTLRVNPQMITQLFQNLIANAIKFRSEEPPKVHVSVRREPAEWTFSVRDNGIGIDSQHSERIFVLFQRLHTRDVYPGSGIGLTLCKKIVESHGGRIWVESQPGHGATFHFTLPSDRSDS